MKKTIIPVVIDTNVIVPSLYSTLNIAHFLLSGDLTLIWNNYIFEEGCRIIEKLGKLYIKKVGVYPDEVIKVFELITSAGYKVDEMPKGWPPISADRKDDPFLFAAYNGNAEFIVSEDRKHMLSLREFMGIPIGKPGSFFRWLISKHPKTS